MYKFECKDFCWKCHYKGRCIIQAQREREVKTILANILNEQVVRDISKEYK